MMPGMFLQMLLLLCMQVLCKKILTSDYAVAVGAGVVISDAACVVGVCCCCRYWCCWCMLLL